MSIIAPFTSKATAFLTSSCHCKILLRSFPVSLAFEQNEAKLKIGKSSNKNSTSEKLVDSKIDSNFIFDENVKSICKSANSKLGVVARVTSYMEKESRIFYLKLF